MAFSNFDNIRGLGRKYEELTRTLKQRERIMRPYERLLESHMRTMASVESPLLRAVRDLQASTAATGTMRSHIQAMADATKPLSGIQQVVADRSHSLDLAKAYGVDGLAAQVARSSFAAGGFQNIVSKIAEQQLPYQSFINTMVEQKLRPLQTLAERVAAAGLPGEVMRDAWRPVLMRGFETPTFPAISQIATMADSLNERLAKSVLNTQPALDTFRASQARQVQDILRTLNAAAGSSPALQHWSAIDKSYRLQIAWVAPVLPERGTPVYRPPTTEPEPFTSFPPAEAPPTEPPLDETPPTAEQGAGQAPAPEDAPEQLTGRWEVLQPVENVLHTMVHGPLIFSILAVNAGRIVVGVIIGGVLFVLFYSS